MKKTNIDLENAITLYTKLQNYREVAKLIDYPASSLYKIFKKNNVFKSPFVNIDLEKAKNIYLETKDLFKTASILGVNVTTLRRKFITNNIKIYSRKYNLNENYFENIDTKDKAYFLGLLYADGCNTRTGLSINLNIKDGYIIEKFKKYINTNIPIKIITFKKENHSPQSNLQITSKKMSLDLIKLGCVPAKSLILKFPTEEQIPKHLIHHFIRGYFDGDGSIYLIPKKRLVFNIVGSFDVITGIKTILEKECNLTNVKIRTNENVKFIAYGSNPQIENIYNWLYKDCGDLYLTRKKEKFEKDKIPPAIFKNTLKCSVDGCNNLQDSKNLCSKHYQNYLKNKKLTLINV